ncbi:TonB-dependent receptor plug domain-containing protein [Flavobacterium rhizosphaerae]|uniref:TonB-dependent receptor n=1 Tax=Flavobacterium rhizosphaerae TaxID=3163298 RepID=A0ABW8YU24_9FLAO
MQRIHKLYYIIFLTGLYASAQGINQDTLANNLNEVVITGQIEPQSINKSVFNVRIISQADIQRQAANNLADVLNQYLNIMVTPNTSAGRSTATMFGLDSQYLKILVDNIPLVSDTGLGNNVDLTQINLNDIERIEIIEGAMGVTHGANAVSGVINIITKKRALKKWELSVTAQEETAGEEYSPFYNKGRHIQALRAAHNINQNWFASVGVNRNDFEGFKDERGGRDFTGYDPDDLDHQRGYSWLPKEQLTTNALIRFQKNSHRVFYKFEFFNEDIDFYNPVVSQELVTGTGLLKYSFDRIYNTSKFYHHLNASGKLGGVNYNVSASLQKQRRNVEEFKYYIQTGQEVPRLDEVYQETQVLYSTGTVSNIIKSSSVSLQAGYEAVNTKGYGSSLSGIFNNDEQGGTNVDKRLENYDVFAASEIQLTESFSIRPGFRYSFQSKFEDQWSGSFGVRKLFLNGYEARASYGRSYRTPNYDELYTYMVDANHNIQGNAALNPESAHSIEASLKKNFMFASGAILSPSLSANYIMVDDRIELAIVNPQPLQYQYININDYKMWNIATANSFQYKNWQARAGLSFMGISRKINAADTTSDNKFLTTYQLNANVAYSITKAGMLLSVYYKLNGKQQQYVDNGSVSDPGFDLQEIQSFGLLDASIRKDFFSGRLNTTFGARNLLDVVTIRSNIPAGSGVHTAGTNNIAMAYGRSYFLKLVYSLNF